MEHNEEQLMRKNQSRTIIPRVFARTRNVAAGLLFAVLALTSRPANAQQTSGDFTYIIFRSDELSARIESYLGDAVDLVISNTLGGYPVTVLGSRLFHDNSALQSVTFPDSLEVIRASAFQNCTGLTELNLPDSLIDITAGAFQGCTGLTEVTLPDAVTNAGPGAFVACSALTNINVSSSNPLLSSRDGILFDKAGKLLFQYPGAKSGPYTIPASVNRIDDFAFHSCNGLTQVTFPPGVNRIGDIAFNSCTNLRRAVFQGYAPTIRAFPSIRDRKAFIFGSTAADFKVQFYEGARGFTAPEWTTVDGDAYPSESLPFNFSIWRTNFGLEAGDLAANGEPLLIAYALNLDPTKAAVRVPAPFIEGGEFRLGFPLLVSTIRSDVLLEVESSTDLPAGNWEPAGVETNEDIASLSIPLTGSDSPEKLYLRFTAEQTE